MERIMSTKLSRKVTYGFAIGDLGGNLFFTLIGFYLLFYLTDIVKLSPALAGIVLMVGKIWDAVTDPVTGYLSDRTITRYGRRRPYIFIGSIAAFFLMGIMFTPVHLASPVTQFLYFALMYALLNTAYTLVNIPYAALLPEITDDYDQRTVLTGYRMSFAVVGTFVGAGAVLPLVGIAGWGGMGYIMGGIMLVTAMITVWGVKEPVHSKDEEQKPFFRTYREALTNRVFLLAMIPWALFITGTTMVQGSLVYFFAYILHDEGLFQAALMLLLAFSLACIPLWVKISERIGKKGAYGAGMTIMSVAVMVFAYFADALGSAGALVIMAVAGTGLSTHYVMPHAILPDTVEHDAVHHGGLRREGVFSSLWTFSSKIGQALALALSGWILALFSYSPDQVTPLAESGIRLITGPFPLLFYVVGILILRRYPIDREYYNTMVLAYAETEE